MGERRSGLDWIEMSVRGQEKRRWCLCVCAKYGVSKVYNAVCWNCLDIMLM